MTLILRQECWQNKSMSILNIIQEDILLLLLVIKKKSILISKICPGDFVFVTYDDVPIIKDMQCEENFEDAVEDHEIGGHNDWYIEDYTKYPKGGWMIKAQRNKRTKDKFDINIDEEPEKVLFAIHDMEYEFMKPVKTGIRSLSKFKKHMPNQLFKL